jgi:hypothetical protein
MKDRAESGHVLLQEQQDCQTAVWFDRQRKWKKVNPDPVVRDKEGEPLPRALRPGQRDLAKRISERATAPLSKSSAKWSTNKKRLRSLSRN